MYDWLKVYFTDPALPSRLLDGLIVALTLAVFVAVALWLGQLSWRQLRSLPGYITASRRRQRQQNFVEIRRRIKDNEYLILMEEDSMRMQFASLLLLLMTVLIVVLQDATPNIVLSNLGLALMVLLLMSMVLIFLSYGVLLDYRNRAARLHRAGMRRNKKTGALERRRPLTARSSISSR